MVAIFRILFLLVIVYLLLLLPRLGHPGWEKLAGFRYAHRGLHNKDKGIPENSMAAFRAALEKGYGIELDIHLMKDGNLAVIHDSSLKRTADADVMIEDLTTEELDHYHLDGTDETMKTESVNEVFQEAAVFRGIHFGFVNQEKSQHKVGKFYRMDVEIAIQQQTERTPDRPEIPGTVDQIVGAGYR